MTDLSIRRTIVVETDQERAFSVFTSRMGAWWPPVYHIGKAAYETAIVEPFAGGRWYERGVDGSECDWGRVLVWNNPSKIVLTWQISPDWEYDLDLVTEIEVTFVAEGPKRTRVDFEHRHLERFGRRAAEMLAIFSTGGVPGSALGWSGILKEFAAVAELAS
jgi:uncharacterized protein YndB with AHSA1/START domain